LVRTTLRNTTRRPCLKIELESRQLICCSSENDYDDNEQNDSEDQKQQTRLQAGD
jgi:hypothetical protein